MLFELVSVCVGSFDYRVINFISDLISLYHISKSIISCKKHQSYLDAMVLVKRGSRFRKELYHFLYVGANTVFPDEEAEYRFVGKFGRGNRIGVQGFSKRGLERIVAFAKDYGAFDKNIYLIIF